MPHIPSRGRAFLPFPPPSTHAPAHPHNHRICATNPAPASHPHPARHTTAINKHAKSGNLSLLQHAVRAATQDGYVLNAVNYTTIANAHADHGNPAHVFRVLALMRSRRVRPTNVTLRVAVKACDKWDNRLRALHALQETLRWVSDARVEPCVRSWNQALRCLARRDAVADLENTFQWMRSSVSHYVPRPNTWSYNTYMASLKKSRRLPHAIALFAAMLTAGRDQRPDAVTYNTLLDLALVADISASEGSSDAEAPRRFVDAILSSMSRQHVVPNLTTETLILRLLCRKGASPPDARFVWHRFTGVLSDRQRSAAVDKKYLDAVITAFAQAPDLHGMHLALTQMTNRNLHPDQLTIRALLIGASHLGDVTLARAILDILLRNGVQPDQHAYTTAISTCARATPLDPTTADELLQQALDGGTQWSSAMVNATISSYGDDSARALQLWKRLRACRDQSSRDVLGERVVYDALMRVCGREARPDLALRVFYAAKRAGHLSANTPDSRAVYSAFRRGVREAELEDDVDGNALKIPFVRHLKTECGVREDFDLPIERIRIKL